MRKRWEKFLLCTVFAALLVPVLAVPAMATGDMDNGTNPDPGGGGQRGVPRHRHDPGNPVLC